MHIGNQQASRFIPLLAALSILVTAAWLPAVPPASIERVRALFQNDEPEKTRIPESLFMPRSESALLPHWAPWGFP